MPECKIEKEKLMPKYKIGTKVLIEKDCRKWERATGKKGVIHKLIPYTIPREYFPLELREINITINLDDSVKEDPKGELHVIKYGRFGLGRIRGYECWWSPIKEKEDEK